MTLEENGPNMTATKAAKKVIQKANEACQEDMKKISRENTLHGRYPQRGDIGDEDKATTHQWLSISSSKGETEGSYWQHRIKAFQQESTNQESLKMGLNPKEVMYKQQGDCRPHNIRIPKNSKQRILIETRSSIQVHTLNTMQALQNITLRKMVRKRTRN